jgi:hypothetical protein
MNDRTGPGAGFSVLDGAALVTGAAVASIHLRGIMRDDLAAPGWALIWGAFSWIALTSAGPFLFLVRRFVRRLPDYPKVCDRLWGMLGLPWILTSLIRAATPGPAPQRDASFAAVLGLGLAVSSLVALIVVWRCWVTVPPETAARNASAPWTNRVGLILAVAWPIQCGLGLVVID